VGGNILKLYDILLFFMLLMLGVILVSCGESNSPPESGSIAQSLSGAGTEGFKRADSPRKFLFPDDFGPHLEFQTEWWYYTGNLSARDGREFGYQLTFFRRSLGPHKIERKSKWAANQIYFAHFALTDVESGQFYSSEKWSRGAAGLAGSQSAPFRVWIDNWSVSGDGNKVRLSAAYNETSIDLALESVKPIVLQGDKGLSQKSGERGNASYYFSQTRLKSAGTIAIGGQRFEVSGLSWLDREWSTSALGEHQEGWDWFSIQLDDGREIMLYQLRLKGGGVDPFSSGSYVRKDGSVEQLNAGDFEIEPLSSWKSPETGIVYPSKWKIKIPEQGMELTVTPLLKNQELLLSFTYWEGAVKFTGDGLSGKGYVELTGY